MALIPDWVNHIITIPHADMTLIQPPPNEIRELDLNVFHNWLKDLETTTEGMLEPLTHNHNTSVILEGIEYARIVEILEPYTFTFEDGQYAVRFAIANTNLASFTNVNQVSIRPNNSAGLISSPDIEFSAYANGVYYKESSTDIGTLHPTGTQRKPVGSLVSAGLIAQYRGVNKGNIVGGTLTVGTESPLDGFQLVGEGLSRTTINILPEASANNVSFSEAHVLGTLDGNSRLVKCLITDLDYVSGRLDDCILSQGTIKLGGGIPCLIIDCKAGEGLSTVDMGGAGQGLILQAFSGPIKVINKTGPEVITAGINSGIINIDMNTVINGTIVASGTGIMVNSNTGDNIPSGTYGNLEVINLLVGNEAIAKEVWDYERV